MEQKVIIVNETGIHARPASMFVQAAAKFKSKITVTAKGKTVDAKSIMGMGLTKGTELTIKAEGADAEDAVKALVELVESKFGE